MFHVRLQSQINDSKNSLTNQTSRQPYVHIEVHVDVTFDQFKTSRTKV